MSNSPEFSEEGISFFRGLGGREREAQEKRQKESRIMQRHKQQQKLLAAARREHVAQTLKNPVLKRRSIALDYTTQQFNRDEKVWARREQNCKAFWKKVKSRMVVDGTLKKVFQQWDADGDGSLSVKEFMRALSMLGLKMPGGDMNAMHQAIDQDGDGRLTLQELENFMSARKASVAYNPARPRMRKNQPKPSRKRVPLKKKSQPILLFGDASPALFGDASPALYSRQIATPVDNTFAEEHHPLGNCSLPEQNSRRYRPRPQPSSYFGLGPQQPAAGMKSYTLNGIYSQGTHLGMFKEPNVRQAW